MIVSIASGKGGTGKTTLAVNLSLALKKTQLIDCDVEEPNCHLFLKPEIERSEFVEITVPDIDESLCDYCGTCARFCQYNALAVSEGVLMQFYEMCHSCGGCMLVCPKKAIKEKTRVIGGINHGKRGDIGFSNGLLNVGEAMSSPVIRQLKRHINPSGDVLLDSPPGTSCAMIEAVKASDYCILVTEPTPFGLNDLKLAVGVLKELSIPYGVVINRDGIGDDEVAKYCGKKGVQVLLRIPHDEDIAKLYSMGETFVDKMHEYNIMLKDMYEKIREDTGK